MNTQFNISRFVKLIKKHTAEHYKTYLMSLIVLIGVLTLGGGFFIYIVPNELTLELQTSMFVIILMVASTIFACNAFADFGDKNKATAALILPASHLEKYLFAWLFSFLVFLLIYTGTFYCIIAFLLGLSYQPGKKTELFTPFNRGMALQMLVLFAFLHSIAFYGSIRFKKLHFIKTGFCFFIGSAALMVFNTILLGLLTGRVIREGTPFANLRFLVNGKEIRIRLPQHRGDDVLWIAVAVALIFWTAAYYRLKEKQV